MENKTNESYSKSEGTALATETEMNAQELIQETEQMDIRQEENLELFFPDLYKLQKAEENLTKVIKGMI